MLAKLFPIDDIITWFLDEINEYMYAYMYAYVCIYMNIFLDQG